jgi:hypothetical protein
MVLISQLRRALLRAASTIRCDSCRLWANGFSQ